MNALLIIYRNATEGKCLAELPPLTSFAGQSHLLTRLMVGHPLDLFKALMTVHRLGKTRKQGMELGNIPEEFAQA